VERGWRVVPGICSEEEGGAEYGPDCLICADFARKRAGRRGVIPCVSSKEEGPEAREGLGGRRVRQREYQRL